MAAFPRRTEEPTLDHVSQHHQMATMAADPHAIEPWMTELLDEEAMAQPPLDWNLLDDFFNHPSSGSDTTFHPIQETESPSASNNQVFDVQNQFSAQVPQQFNAPDAAASFLLDPNAFSPQPTLFDQSPPQDLFNSFDTMPAEAQAPTEEPSQAMFDQVAAAFKAVARARANADPRPLSRKQKQRDASMALYLQRLRDTCDEAVAMLAPPSQQQQQQQQYTSFTTPDQWWAENMVPMACQPSSAGTTSTESFELNNHHLFSNSASPGSSFDSCTDPSPAPSAAKKRRTTAGPTNAGVELVLDLNMNTATSVPRKHKPRTRAQRERYLAVRNQGACEKHKKQHKRCTCIDQPVETKWWAMEDAAIRSRANRPVSSPRASHGIQQPQQSAETNSNSCTAGCPSGLCSCDDRRSVEESRCCQLWPRHTHQRQQSRDLVRSPVLQSSNSPSSLSHNSSASRHATGESQARSAQNRPVLESGTNSPTGDRLLNSHSPDIELACRGGFSDPGHDYRRSLDQRQPLSHTHRNGNATQDSSSVSSGTSGHDHPPGGSVPNPHCTNVQRKRNTGEKHVPAGMGRYDIKDVSSATRISTTTLSSMSSRSALVSVFNQVRQVSCSGYQMLQYACMACMHLLTRKGWQDDWVSSRTFWMVVWSVLLIFSFLLGSTNPAMDSFYFEDPFV